MRFFAFGLAATLLTGVVSAQPVPAPPQEHRLDSLLLAGAFQAVGDFWETQERTLPQARKTADYVAAREGYLHVLRRVDAVADLTPAAQRAQATTFRAQANQYTLVYAGPAAHAAFARFAEEVARGEHAAALPHYFVAVYLKRKYQPLALRHLRTQLAEAQQQLAAGAYPEARLQLATLDLADYPGTAFAPVRDSIASLQRTLQRRMSAADRELANWGRTERHPYRVQIGVGGLFLLPFTAPEDLTLALGNGPIAAPGFDVEVPQLTSTVHYGGQGELAIRLQPQFFITGRFLYSTATYSPEAGRSFLFFDYTITRTSGVLQATWRLRDQVGIQPFIGLGAGLLHEKRHESQATIVRLSVENDVIVGTRTDEYTLAAAAITTPLAHWEVGVTYIDAAASRVYTSGTITGFHALDALPRYATTHIGFNVRIGLLF